MGKISDIEYIDRLKENKLLTQNEYQKRRSIIVAQELSESSQKNILQELFSFKGRRSRRNYFKLFFLILSVFVILIISTQGFNSGYLMFVSILLPLYIFGAQTVKRLHDLNISGKWVAIPVIFFVTLMPILIPQQQNAFAQNTGIVTRLSFFILLICLGFSIITLITVTIKKSSKETNVYGAKDNMRLKPTLITTLVIFLLALAIFYVSDQNNDEIKEGQKQQQTQVAYVTQPQPAPQHQIKMVDHSIEPAIQNHKKLLSELNLQFKKTPKKSLSTEDIEKINNLLIELYNISIQSITDNSFKIPTKTDDYTILKAVNGVVYFSIQNSNLEQPIQEKGIPFRENQYVFSPDDFLEFNK